MGWRFLVIFVKIGSLWRMGGIRNLRKFHKLKKSFLKRNSEKNYTKNNLKKLKFIYNGGQSELRKISFWSVDSKMNLVLENLQYYVTWKHERKHFTPNNGYYWNGLYYVSFLSQKSWSIFIANFTLDISLNFLCIQHDSLLRIQVHQGKNLWWMYEHCLRQWSWINQ